MLVRRYLALLLITLFSVTTLANDASANRSNETEIENTLASTVFELERSLAILQLSSVRQSDYQVLAEQVAANHTLQSKVDFLIVFCALLFLSLIWLIVRVHQQHKQLQILVSKSQQDNP
ncbi:hypothetical protein [Marinomonas epiphytica]